MKARIIALYLPQFHPIPENDEWWGKGFTEWTNVRRARPLFLGHDQPRRPTTLGYYDLRDADIRTQQALLAQEAGVEAFCYYHYWFGGGRQLLERPFNEVVASGRPHFPFCLCWANHTWSNKTWEHTARQKRETVLMAQTYPGDDDDIAHFYALLPAFSDERYVKVDGKLLFVVYSVFDFPHVERFISTWRRLAEENGLPGFHFVGMCPATLTYTVDRQGRHRTLPNTKSSKELYNWVLAHGFDAVNSFGKRRAEMLYDGIINYYCKVLLRRWGGKLRDMTYDYERVVRNFFPPEDTWESVYPTILPQWDRTPRVATKDGVYVNVTPAKFEQHIRRAINIVQDKSPEHRIIFLKSWNEWGEGNYVEPDATFGHGLLQALAAANKG